jgi:hypothetical protein
MKQHELNHRVSAWVTVDTLVPLDTYAEADAFDVGTLTADVAYDHPLALPARTGNRAPLAEVGKHERSLVLARVGVDDDTLWRLVPGLYRRGRIDPDAVSIFWPDVRARIDAYYESVLRFVRADLRCRTAEAAWYRDMSVRCRGNGDVRAAVHAYKRIAGFPRCGITPEDVAAASAAEDTLSRGGRAFVAEHTAARGLVRALRGTPFRCTDSTPVGASLGVLRELLGA